MVPHSTLAIIGKSDASITVRSAVHKRLGHMHNIISPDSLADLMADDANPDWLANLALVTVTVHDNGLAPDHPLVDFINDDRFDHVRIVVFTTAPSVTGLDMLTNLGRLDMLIYLGEIKEIKEGALVHNLRHQLRRYWHTRAETEPALRGTYEEPEHFLLSQDLSDKEIIDEIIAVADHHLGFQPRITMPAGTYLTRENDTVEEIIFVLSGTVRLQRLTEQGPKTMHHASTGNVIGLLALSNSSVSFFTARTSSEVVVVQLPVEQLNYLLKKEPHLARVLTTLVVQSYDRRLRRAEHLQIEQFELKRHVETQRANLAEALKNLEDARQELMAQARFASLGELAAGVAHELNNPLAAIQRTSEHLYDDITTLMSTATNRKSINSALTAIEAAKNTSSISTKNARQLRNTFAEITGDRALAQRLVLAGVRDEDFVREVNKSRRVSFEAVENAAGIGTSLRNLNTASTRITELVASLRAYARPDGDPVSDVDVHQGIDDTLHLMNHKLGDITVKRNYADLPHITCTPGQLAQVWTNLIANSAEAIADSGTGSSISIRTSQPREGWIQVEIIDDGPGIQADRIDRIFEPKFTTKQGQVRFGMGIGLGVCRSIVSKHHGTIQLESTGGDGTRVIVGLPIDGPNALQED
ncbi:ATP-binding protein [Corynebacterium pilosum]|uniref:histidine kinase n=2 Tax=Corynebacterium pilosum TaxID=35756 RepID=A0A376CME9_9CORY|nr:ATP-binding protein [Corynebacterium pilosum]STC69387.1 two-component system sensor histidine kinase [Corynebacterium pilosum]